MAMVSASALALLLKLSMTLLFAAWVCLWILKPMRIWKKSWHMAEDRASTTFMGDYGLNVAVFCFPLLGVATLGYIYMHLCEKQGKLVRRGALWSIFAHPVIINSPIGIISLGELLGGGLFVALLSWTYYSNVADDFQMLTFYAHLKLNRLQLKVMHMGVRVGSLSEFCLSVLLLPIVRGMSIFRIIGVQFEVSVRYHIWIANAIVLLSTLHGITIMSVWAAKRRLLKEIISWQRVGRVNIAGAIALSTALVIWVTSLPWIRRKQFQTFYLIHHLYVVFILFYLIHVGDKHFYLVFSGVLLFALDKILRMIQARRETSLVSAHILPCKAVELTFPVHPSVTFTPTSMIFLKVPSISHLQWHPFSVTSSCIRNNDTLSVLVKCQGQWTEALYNKFNSVADVEAGQFKRLSVAIDGPYGPFDLQYQRYSNLVLIAGGSGITPFLSILHDAASRNAKATSGPSNIVLIYCVRLLQDLSMLAPVSSLLLSQHGTLGSLKLKIFVTQEQGSTTTPNELLRGASVGQRLIMQRNSPRGCVARQEGLLCKAVITLLSFFLFLASLVCLNHLFIHQGKKLSKNKTPSWVGDLFVLTSFVIATTCCAAATVLVSCKKLASRRKVPREVFEDTHEKSLKIQDSFVEHEIHFGKRPNLEDILSGLPDETRESNFGVFVCGPDSMKSSVASFCSSYSRKYKTSSGGCCSFCFHSLNFSL